MNHYPLHSLPITCEAQELSGGDRCLRRPTTSEDVLDILQLLPAKIQAHEGRSVTLASPPGVRVRCVLHIREVVLQLQQEGESSYAGGPQLAFPTLRQPEWPTFYDPEELSDDDLCLRAPKTIEDLLDILHLLPALINEAERRSAYRRELHGVRAECVAYLREMVLQLQQDGITGYAGMSLLHALRRPA